MSKWQLIETLPKSHVPFLVATAAGIVGEAWQHQDTKLIYWAQEHPNDYAGGDPVDATHWMPLPAPPLPA
jgi:hypothetical protein